MKKFILGLVIGMAIMIPVGAHAEVESLINQVVQGMFPVSIDGKPLGNAIVVDNKTYLPVRDFGEAVGYKVTFTDDQQVVLTKGDTTPTTPTTSGENTLMKQIREINDKLGKLVNEKQSLEKQINDIHTKNALNGKVDGDDIKELQKQVDAKQAEIDKLVADKQPLESQLQSQP